MFVADTLLPKVALLPRQAPLPYQGLHIYKCHLRWTMGSAALMSSTTRFGDTVVGLLAFVMARSHSSWPAHIRHGTACPGHLSRHGACSGGPDKPCHDGNDQPEHDGN